MAKIETPRSSIFAIDRKIVICLILVLSIFAVYGNVRHYGFINYDDIGYVVRNDHVKSGLTIKGLIWSFQTSYFCNWHPLTWISHMVDVEFYGMVAGGHHLTNVFFHIANTLLLFILLSRMTAALWPSAFVATLFALHPLHVESVAWVAERKDVLSTFFGLLSLISYVQYTQQRSRRGYMLALLFFILGLMAKPMLVSLPFLLLLLDYWPLERVEFHGRFHLQPSGGVAGIYFLVVEKLPFFVFTAASCIVTYYAQQSGGAVMPIDAHPMGIRVASAVVSYVAYIGKMFWPVNLAILYPLSDSFTVWQVGAAAALLLGVSLGVLTQIRQRPYLAVGWFWYVGTLVPVIGLVQVGSQAMADRYTYIPLIGLFVMIAWGAPEVFGRWRLKPVFLTCSAGIAILTLMILTHGQIRHWSNSVKLFEHAARATGYTWVAHYNLANALKDQGRIDEALEHYHLALQKEPRKPENIYNSIALVLGAVGRYEEAIENYAEALRINPDFADAHINLGVILARQGKKADAIYHYSEALRIDPNLDKAHFNLGNALLAESRIDEAIISFSKALRINPLFAEAYNSMGMALMQKGEIEKAILNYRKAANIKPAYLDTQKNQKLAESIYAKISKAVAGMRDSMNFNPQDPEIDIKMMELLDKKIELDQAVYQFNKALSLQPGFTAVDRNKISMVFDIKKQYEKKLSLFLKIIEDRPDNAEADYHIACVYSRKGQINDAIKWLNQAVQNGFSRWDLLKADSDLNAIRDSKEFQMLAKDS
jgi:tetratricopeptide (TPR) repeat protein